MWTSILEQLVPPNDFSGKMIEPDLDYRCEWPKSPKMGCPVSRVLCEKWEPQKPTPYAVVVALTVNVTRPNEHPITFSKRIAGRQVAPVYLDLDARTEDNSLSSNSSLKIEYRDAKSFMSNNLRHQSSNFCPDRNIRTDSK
jgi:hypothetical protein